MANEETLVTKAADLCSYINTLSALLESQKKPQKKLIVSFDVYCILLEYTALMNQAQQNRVNTSVDELISITDLVYETPQHQLTVEIDFFLPPGVVDIQ